MNDKRSRWLALYVLCLGDLMIVLDMNIVNVALPTIQEDLGFSQTALAWVVNAYLLTFGGFLLLSGRLADLYGAKRVFQGGVVFFTVASVACGLAWTSELLVIGRGIQGLGGAAVSAVALALIMRLFDEPADQAKAMGFFGFVMSGGGALGVLLGGVLTDLLSWNWIFLVNVPIGVAVWLLASRLLPADEEIAAGGRLDLPGAVLVTASLMLATYGVVGGNEAGWTSVETVALLGTSLALLAAFVVVEARSSHPLMPLRLFKQRNISISQVVGVLWAGAMFACFFISALYMQFIQGWDALQIGLAYLPTCLVMAYCSLRVSDKLVMKYGIRKPLFAGLTLASVSLGLFALAPVDGSYVVNVLPSMILLGIGAGIAFNPVLLAAMGDVEPHESGLASGVVNTSFMMGGALGLAVFVALSEWRTDNLLADGSAPLEALNGGYQLSFAAAAVAALAAAIIGGVFLKPKPMQMPGAEGSEVGQPEVEAGAV
jgi:EmrB/QacA subfamily drug resistance transporter